MYFLHYSGGPYFGLHTLNLPQTVDSAVPRISRKVGESLNNKYKILIIEKRLVRLTITNCLQFSVSTRNYQM